VSGNYTYSRALTVQAFNTSAVQVASATSLYSNNTALNGAPGSSPNELVSSAGGIASITITSGGVNSFTPLDDLSYGAIITTVPTVSVPAMGGLVFLLALAGCLAAGRQARAGGMAALTLLMIASVPHPPHAAPPPACQYKSPQYCAEQADAGHLHLRHHRFTGTCQHRHAGAHRHHAADADRADEPHQRGACP
jgi:hypothetical protein